MKLSWRIIAPVFLILVSIFAGWGFHMLSKLDFANGDDELVIPVRETPLANPDAFSLPPVVSEAAEVQARFESECYTRDVSSCSEAVRDCECAINDYVRSIQTVVGDRIVEPIPADLFKEDNLVKALKIMLRTVRSRWDSANKEETATVEEWSKACIELEADRRAYLKQLERLESGRAKALSRLQAQPADKL
jgi:hypothetical protein